MFHYSSLMSTPTGEPKARSPWGGLNRDRIIAVAQDIARREGLEALTIRRLATDLGVSRMALYRHVPDKEALVGLTLDAIARQDIVPPVPETGPWPQRLRALALGMHRELGAYPGTIDVLTAPHTHHGPGPLRLVETILTILTDAGLDERDTARYYLVFLDLVLGRLQREAHGDPIANHRQATIATEPDAPDQLRAIEPHLRNLTPEDIFHTELDMLIAAITTHAHH